MTIRTILVTMHPDIDPAPQLDTALALAHRLSATVEALYVRPDTAAALAAMPDALGYYSISYEALEQASQEHATRARKRYEAWRDAQPGTPQPTYWSEHEGMVEAVLERYGRLADLLVLRHPESQQPETERAFDAAVFGSGRPCLLVRDRVPKDLLRHVVVAWNGSLQGTRAVAGAMPLLGAADQVSIFSATRPDGDAQHGPEFARALARHGIQARLLPIPEGGGAGAVGPALLQAAAGASLLVMGAYTHSRVRQTLLGGVTRHVLAHAGIPVLMGH